MTMPLPGEAAGIAELGVFAAAEQKSQSQARVSKARPKTLARKFVVERLRKVIYTSHEHHLAEGVSILSQR